MINQIYYENLVLIPGKLKLYMKTVFYFPEN